MRHVQRKGLAAVSWVQAGGGTVKLTVTVDVPMTVEQLAGLFAELDDDSQARFFVEVAKAMATWTLHERYMQAIYIGRHLRDCTCSTEDARELLREIVGAMAPAGGT
jgi:hypothetical protein